MITLKDVVIVVASILVIFAVASAFLTQWQGKPRLLPTLRARPVAMSGYPTGGTPVAMSSDVKDPAQEFAERVAEKWNSRVGNGMEALISTIASELRAGGWEPRAPQKVERSSWNQYSCRYHIGEDK